MRIEHLVAAALTVLATLFTAGHAVLYKRDSRAASGWLALIWIAPLIGPILYWGLGVNRIKRSAVRLRSRPGHAKLGRGRLDSKPAETFLPEGSRHLARLARTVDRVVGWPLVSGNRVEPFVNGDEAYPAMLRAIDGAGVSVALASYIFADDAAGGPFIEALIRAAGRGAEVRVLVDGVGSRYSFPSALDRLREAGVAARSFLPTINPLRMSYWNLRSHRKLLVVDGRKAFTGGMNIAEGNLVSKGAASPIQDLHFELEGPVAAQLQEAFAEDWLFCAGEDLKGEKWFPEPKAAGEVYARGIPDGPDADFDKLRWTILAAIGAARSSIKIVTPYFLPDQALTDALNGAALSGVDVDIVLPQRGNLPLVQHASEAELWQVLVHGCRVWGTPPPFDHSKLMLVDGAWALLGSANWDPRSLRLNFEFNVECFGVPLAARLDAIVEAKLLRARALTQAELNRRSLAAKLRDGTARLFSPYL